MHTPINVSFGIEFEMIVLYEAKKYEAELKSGEGVHWQSSSDESIIGLREKMLILIRIEMIKVLTDHGIPTNKWGRAEDYTKWTVEHDGTIALEEDGVQDWCAIELKTPAFFYHPWALDQVKRVLDVVKKNFTTVVNDSCGLHVHVGNCHKGYPLRTLKNFAMLITSFERQFSSLHPFDRINNHFVRPVSESFPPSSVRDKLVVIESCHTIEQLIQNFNYDNNKWTAYSFLTLLNSSLRTVEFRQHSGTLDIEAITHWAKLSISLINLAHSASHSGFYNLIKSHALDDVDNNYNIINLLNDLKLPDLADYYSKPPRVIYNHPIWGSEEWDFQPKSEPESLEESSNNNNNNNNSNNSSSRQSDDSTTNSNYWRQGDFIWKDESDSDSRRRRSDSASSASIEPTFHSYTKNLYQNQRGVEVVW